MTAYPGLTEEQIEEYRQDGLSNHQLAKQNEQVSSRPQHRDSLHRDSCIVLKYTGRYRHV